MIGLLVFAGLLAVRAVELHCPEQVDDIIKWVTDFLNTELSEWLEARGGWVICSVFVVGACYKIFKLYL